jgi:hypothetical protein
MGRLTIEDIRQDKGVRGREIKTAAEASALLDQALFAARVAGSRLRELAGISSDYNDAPGHDKPKATPEKPKSHPGDGPPLRAVWELPGLEHRRPGRVAKCTGCPELRSRLNSDTVNHSFAMELIGDVVRFIPIDDFAGALKVAEKHFRGWRQDIDKAARETYGPTVTVEWAGPAPLADIPARAKPMAEATRADRKYL